jgi:predicted transport protein
MKKVYLNIIESSLIVIFIGAVGWIIYTNNAPNSNFVELLISVSALLIAYFSFRISISNKIPDLLVSLDFDSRYQLGLFKVKNIGEKTAHDICIKIGDTKNLEEIKQKIPHKFVLQPQAELSYIINVQHKIDYSEQITVDVDFCNKRLIKIKLNSSFLLDFNSVKDTPSYTKEESKTAFELQKIPYLLKEISESLKSKK